MKPSTAGKLPVKPMPLQPMSVKEGSRAAANGRFIQPVELTLKSFKRYSTFKQKNIAKTTKETRAEKGESECVCVCVFLFGETEGSDGLVLQQQKSVPV